MSYKIGEASRIARISVRALRHYDDVGLVVPSARSAAGYRLYTDGDLERLQQVLFYRELGFGLERIAALLADPRFDRRRALQEQRALLVETAERSRALVRLIDKTLMSMDGGKTMSPEESFEGFDPSKYDDEANERWGSTHSYAESKRRTARYSKEDWATIRAEAESIETALADAMERDEPADGAAAMDLAERHRMHIDRWFYPCSPQMHVGLADMYVADPRFAAHYDARRAGLAAFVRDAIHASAARATD
jgi:DNA-binding transcriptional MerR regulator